VQDAYAYCEKLVREIDKERYLAALFVPAQRRPHVFALYAFSAEIARVRDLAHEPLPGEIRLQWWRDALAGLGRGEASGNPVTAALLDTMERCGLPREPVLGLIDAHGFDLYDEPMATLGALEDYLRATSVATVALCVRVLGDVAAGLAHAIDCGGVALGIATILRSFAVHRAHGRLLLPLDILAKHDVDPGDVMIGSPAGLSAVLADLRAHARGLLADSRFEEIAASTPAAPALLPLALAAPLLDRSRRQDRDPFAAVELPQWRAQWALWRAAQRLF
jgi:15-cis-phytoene synthase